MCVCGGFLYVFKLLDGWMSGERVLFPRCPDLFDILGQDLYSDYDLNARPGLLAQMSQFHGIWKAQHEGRLHLSRVLK